jgi:LysR family transcriptional regulator, low CO2-responsive transcriptional regulator
MTLTQLNAFVLVARLGSVTAAANALGVSESAVSQALSALRQHLGDQLVTRGPSGMTLTAGGSRLLSTASQIVVLGAEAHAAVRAAQGAPEQLRVVSMPAVAEFLVSPLVEAFTARFPGAVEVSSGVASAKELGVLVANRLADVAIGTAVPADPALHLGSEPIFRYRLVVVTAGQPRLRGTAKQWRWFVDPSGTDPGSETGRLLAALGICEDRVRVFPNQTAAWAAAADGGGVAPAVEHLVAQQVRRGELSVVDVPGCPADACWYVTLLERDHRSVAASSFRRFLGTPEAMRLMRSPAAGVPPSRFRPPVYVTIWSLSNHLLPRCRPSPASESCVHRGRRRARANAGTHPPRGLARGLARPRPTRRGAACGSSRTGTAGVTRGCSSWSRTPRRPANRPRSGRGRN